MGLQTAVVIANALATGERGSSGEVLDPIIVENATPLDMLEGVPESDVTFGNSGTFFKVTRQSPYTKSISITGRIHPDGLGRILHAPWGAPTIAAEGSAYKATWATCGVPWEQCIIDRYSTAAASTGVFSRAYMNQFTINTFMNSECTYTLGYMAAKRVIKATNPTVSVPAMAGKDLELSNVTNMVSIVSWTPTGGSAFDITTDLLSFSYNFTRGVTDRGSPLSVFPNSVLPDPSPMIDEKISFTALDGGGALTPLLKYVAAVQGNATGTPGTTWGKPCSGALSVKLIGGVTAGDATKYFTLEMSGTAQISGGQTSNGVFTGEFKCNTWLTKTLINDVASVARPT
jgi:hypothetical protein